MQCRPLKGDPFGAQSWENTTANLLEALYSQGILLDVWNSDERSFAIDKCDEIAALLNVGFSYSYLKQHQELLKKYKHTNVTKLLEELKKRNFSLSQLLEHPRSQLLMTRAEVVLNALEEGIDLKFLTEGPEDTVSMLLQSEDHIERYLKQEQT